MDDLEGTPILGNLLIYVSLGILCQWMYNSCEADECSPERTQWTPFVIDIPSGYVNIAIEHCHL